MRCFQHEEWSYEDNVWGDFRQISYHGEYVIVVNSPWDHIDSMAYTAFLEGCVWTEHLLIEVDAVEDEEVKKCSYEKVVDAELSDDCQYDVASCVLLELISSMSVHWP